MGDCEKGDNQEGDGIPGVCRGVPYFRPPLHELSDEAVDGIKSFGKISLAGRLFVDR